MTAVSDAKQLFTEKHSSYTRFIRFARYPQGIRAFFLRSPLLRSGLRVRDTGCGTGVITLALRDALLRRGLTPGRFDAFDLTPAMLAVIGTPLDQAYPARRRRNRRLTRGPATAQPAGGIG